MLTNLLLKSTSLTDLKTTDIKLFKGSIMIIYIYSFIYILLLYKCTHWEDRWSLFFVRLWVWDTEDWIIVRESVCRSPVDLKSRQPCRGPNCHKKSCQSFFHHETDEFGDKYLLSVHSPSSLFPRVHIINRSFLAPTLCFVGDPSVKLFFVEGRGRAFILEKQGQKFFLWYLWENLTLRSKFYDR